MARRRVEPLYLACSPLQAFTTWLGVWANGWVILWCAYWLARHHGEAAPAWPWCVVGALVALFLADFLSGVVHWATDTWFDEALLERVVSIAREHHLYPHHIAGYGARDYVGYSSWPTALILGPVGSR